MVTFRNIERPNPSLLSSFYVLLLVLVLMFAAFLYGRGRAHHGLSLAFAEHAKKAELVARMQHDLHTSVDAEKYAVMADTDEASISFAEEARQASSALERERLELERLIHTSGQTRDIAPLAQFSEAWGKFLSLQHEILDLAVENSNLKALKLSFAPAREALDRLEAALHKLQEKAASMPDAASVVRTALEALTAAVKIRALHAQHIVEPRDEEMERIEGEMKELDLQVTERLETLAKLSDETLRAFADEAKAAYADFQNLSAEIVRLSRRNTNVHSLSLSLGKQRNAIAACRDLLDSLRDAIKDEGPRPTR